LDTRRIARLGAACLLLFFASRASALPPAELVVAQVAPFSGPVALYSRATQIGATAMFESVNARGGVHGARLRLVTHDDGLDADRTLALYREVARRDKPIAFLYPVGPVAITRLLKERVPQELGVPVVGTIPALYRLRTPVNPFVFHIGQGDDAELIKIVSHIATMGIRSIGMVFWDEPTAHDAVAFVEREAQRHGVALGMRSPVPAGTAKVEAAVEAIAGSTVGAVIVILPVNATAALVAGLRAKGNGLPVYGPSYTDSKVLFQLAGKPAVGVGVSQIVPNPFSRKTALVREFRENIVRFGPGLDAVNTLSLEGYIAARILVEALQRAGPNPTPAALRNQLEGLRDFDLGGLAVNYGPAQHVGLSFLDIGVVTDAGRLQY